MIAEEADCRRLRRVRLFRSGVVGLAYVLLFESSALNICLSGHFQFGLMFQDSSVPEPVGPLLRGFSDEACVDSELLPLQL